MIPFTVPSESVR